MLVGNLKMGVYVWDTELLKILWGEDVQKKMFKILNDHFNLAQPFRSRPGVQSQHWATFGQLTSSTVPLGFLQDHGWGA